jgi:hypothetical protein
MFHVTLLNLAPDARSTTEGGGPVELGQLSAEELTALLNVFTELDAVENMKVDPEIRVQSRRDRYTIRTGQKKLFLYDARRPSDPAHVLNAAEIIAELDGSAVAKRTAPPFSLQPSTDGESTSTGFVSQGERAPPPVVEGRPWPFALLGLVLLLGGYIAYTEFAGNDGGSAPALTPLPSSERLTEDSDLTAVFMTGSEPGQHGIVILGDGKLKLFQVCAQSAPRIVHGTYRLGRLEAKICLTTDQPGGLIKVVDRDTLDYAGEVYRRIP